jgi:glc operon protein GlcG
MHRLMIAAACAALLLSPLAAVAQTPPPPAPPMPYGPSIGLDAAKKAIAAAEAEAKKNGWWMVIAVVDTASKLVAFERMDNTQMASIELALGKATTANNLKRPTKALQDALAQGGAGLRFLAIPGVLPIDGGLPIVADGKIIGAIGVSGAASNQDAECAAAGVAAAVAK